MTNLDHIKVLSPNFENYLKIIGDIEANKGQVRSKDIARVMGFSPASVTNALKILREQKLIDYSPYNPIALTERGRQTWRIIHQKYKAVKDFITDILEVDNKSASKLACTIEHSISSQVVERLMVLKQLLMGNITCGNDVMKNFHEYFADREDGEEKGNY